MVTADGIAEDAEVMVLNTVLCAAVMDIKNGVTPVVIAADQEQLIAMNK